MNIINKIINKISDLNTKVNTATFNYVRPKRHIIKSIFNNFLKGVDCGIKICVILFSAYLIIIISNLKITLLQLLILFFLCLDVIINYGKIIIEYFGDFFN